MTGPKGVTGAPAGVRGLLLDLDGVLLLAGRPIPGAADAIRALDARRVPYRIVTNTSVWSRPTLSRYGESLGLSIPPSRILSALSVSAAYTREHFDGRPIYVLATDDARIEFDGQRLLLYVPEGTDTDTRSKLLQDWQRKQLRLAVPSLVAHWEPTTSTLCRRRSKGPSSG